MHARIALLGTQSALATSPAPADTEPLDEACGGRVWWSGNPVRGEEHQVVSE
jgi:hypothetical protein